MFHIQDPEWRERITEFRRRTIEIKLPSNIEPSQGKYILSQIDDVYSEIRLIYGDIKKQLDEADSLIERIRRKAESVGNNSEERKAKGIRAVENIHLDDEEGTVINLYSLRTTLTHQKEDLEGLLAVIEKKQSMVITMSGLLKIESNIAGH